MRAFRPPGKHQEGKPKDVRQNRRTNTKMESGRKLEVRPLERFAKLIPLQVPVRSHGGSLAILRVKIKCLRARCHQLKVLSAPCGACFSEMPVCTNQPFTKELQGSLHSPQGKSRPTGLKTTLQKKLAETSWCCFEGKPKGLEANAQNTTPRPRLNRFLSVPFRSQTKAVGLRDRHPQQPRHSRNKAWGRALVGAEVGSAWPLEILVRKKLTLPSPCCLVTQSQLMNHVRISCI